MELQAALDSYVPVDSFFGAPYIDVDEQVDVPLPHRYLHGGFTGTATRFSLYCPVFDSPGDYTARLWQNEGGGYGGSEFTMELGDFPGLAYAASRGGFLVLGNQGHIGA